jgi:ATP-dependent Clp protease protease subunit
MLNLKHLFMTALITLSLITFGCAGMKAQPTVVKHELAITVNSVEEANVFDLAFGLDHIHDIINVEGIEDTKSEEKDTTIYYEDPENPYLEPSALMMINRAEDLAFVKLFSGLSVSDVTRLWQDIMYLAYETKIRTVKIFINSPGGDAFSGLALADLIMNAQQWFDISFEAHAFGIIASAAVPPFAVCKKRFAASGTIFMVHEAALWKWPGRETASDIRSQNELMIMLQDRYLNYLVAHTNVSLDDWQAMEKKTTWFNADQAMELGLVDEIK